MDPDYGVYADVQLVAERAGPEGEPHRRVVIAGDDHGPQAQLPHHPAQEVVQQLHGVLRRVGDIVDVAGDQQGVRALPLQQVDDLIEERPLVLDEPHPIQAPAQVQIPDVYKARHGLPASTFLLAAWTGNPNHRCPRGKRGDTKKLPGRARGLLPIARRNE